MEYLINAYIIFNAFLAGILWEDEWKYKPKPEGIIYAVLCCCFGLIVVLIVKFLFLFAKPVGWLNRNFYLQIVWRYKVSKNPYHIDAEAYKKESAAIRASKKTIYNRYQRWILNIIEKNHPELTK